MNKKVSNYPRSPDCRIAGASRAATGFQGLLKRRGQIFCVPHCLKQILIWDCWKEWTTNFWMDELQWLESGLPSLSITISRCVFRVTPWNWDIPKEGNGMNPMAMSMLQFVLVNGSRCQWHITFLYIPQDLHIEVFPLSIWVYTF